MKPRISATLVAVIGLAVFTLGAKTSPSKTAKPPAPAVVAEYPASEVQTLVKKITAKRKKCQKLLRNGEEASGLCSEMKVLEALESIVKSYAALEQRYDFLRGKTKVLTHENLGLRTEIQGMRSPATIVESKTCYKPQLLHELMVDEGINVNGNVLFSKLPIGKLGVCWANSKKRREATIALCNYPLAIYFKTKGGTDKSPVIRERQYIFDLKGCDLVVVNIHEESASGKKDTFLNYDNCIETWNKRTADAAMNAKQVKLMQDTIGACFRYRLLPPRNENGGRTNPKLPPPPGAATIPNTF